MNILAIDTSAKVTSVAIINEDIILADFNIDTKLTHSQALMPMVNTALSIAQIALCDIDGYAVASGPGSFTGLRIGIAAIKGLAYANNKPCVSVSTLHALALNVSDSDSIICATMDARCGQVYTAIFESIDGKLHRLSEDMAVTIDHLMELLQRYEKNIFFVGDGSNLCYNKAIQTMHNIRRPYFSNRLQRAASVGYASIDSFLSGDVITAAQLMPLYLRLPQAERELLAKQGMAR